MNFLKQEHKNSNKTSFKIINADFTWYRKEQKKTIRILIVFGIIIFTASIIYQNILFALVRLFIFFLACLIIYYKADSFINYQLLFYSNDKIIFKKGLFKKEIFLDNTKDIKVSRNGKYWLVGENNIKVLISAFPDLDLQIKNIFR